MRLVFESRALQQRCESVRASDEAWGPARAAAVRRRLEQLAAARTLAVAALLPGGVQWDGRVPPQFVVRAVSGLHLVSECLTEDGVPIATDHVDPHAVTTVRILRIEELHGC